MNRAWLVVLALAACHHQRIEPEKPKLVTPDEEDPDGPHRDAIATQVKPFIDADIASSIVIGVYDDGKREIYGFGAGPKGKAPDGRTLYEIGSVTKVFTSLLLADAIQRRELGLDTKLAELLPPGVTAPTKDDTDIVLAHLALHNSGLPRVPPSMGQITDLTDPYAKYDENQLYQDLLHTGLEAKPGEQVAYSNYGAGLLGFVLGKKLGGGSYAKALTDRVITPLGFKDTAVGFPDTALGRRAVGTDEDLKAVPNWHFNALAGAGALVSSTRDMLAMVDAEIDAANGGGGTLRHAMKLTHEPELESTENGNNEGLGWQIDPTGRLWHNGSTGGYHAFVGFDPKAKRGVVILASTASSLLDRLADTLYAVLDGTAKEPAKLATPQQITTYAGSYDFNGEKLAITAGGNRLYIEGRGEPRHRLVPLSEKEFWIEALSAVAIFEDGKMIFVLGGHQFEALRVKN